MPTVVTKTVKPSGGDYTSLSAAEAGEQGDLVTLDRQVTIECYAMEDTASVLIDGWVTDATRYIRITVPISERHDGKRNGTKYRLHAPTNFSYTLRVLEDYCRFEGLQVKNTASNHEGAVLVQANNVRLSDCLAYDGALVASGSRMGFNVNIGNPTQLINCVAMNFVGSGFNVSSGGSCVVYAYNCVSVNCGGRGFFVSDFRTLHCKNCYAGGNSLDDFGKQSANATLNLTTCHSEDTTGNTQTAFSTASGARFTNITAGSEDLHIASNSALRNVGTNLSADGNWLHPNGPVDIDGNERTIWDVGIDEYIPVTNVRTVKSSGGDYTSLSAWEAGRQSDIVTADVREVAECYVMIDANATSVVVDGWTTDNERYVRITVPQSERHPGYRDLSKYLLRVNGGFGAALNVLEDNVRVEGLQLQRNANTGQACLRFSIAASGADCRASDCIGWATNTTPASACFDVAQGATVRMQNCIAFADLFNEGFAMATAAAATAIYHNCESVNADVYGFRFRGFGAQSAKNCYAGGSGTADFFKDGATPNPTLTTCISADLTADDFVGSGNVTGVAFSTSSGAYFTNVTAGSENLHIQSASALKDAGTDLSRDANWVHPNGAVDIDGDSRTVPWDVGVDEAITQLASSMTVNIHVTGQQTSLVAFSARLTGQVISNQAWGARVVAQADSARLYTTRVTGEDQSFVVYDTRLSGLTSSEVVYATRATGQLTSSHSQNVRLIGQTDSSFVRSVKLIAQADDALTRAIRAIGQATSDVGRTIRLVGEAALAHAKNIRLTGQEISSIQRNVRLNGQSESARSQATRLAGSAEAFVARNVRVTGVFATEFAIGVRLYGGLPEPITGVIPYSQLDKIYAISRIVQKPDEISLHQ